MIRWNLKRREDLPALSLGEPPAGILSAPEQVFLRRLKLAKRRDDWILGRWAAKTLALAYLEQERGVRFTADRLSVAQAPDGAPYLVLAGEGRLPVTIRISHRAGWAMAAIAPGEDLEIGADLELIESRHPSFLEDFFTEAEVRQVRAAPETERDRMITQLWSVKESVLKALKLGLRGDTRWVEAEAPPIASEALWRVPVWIRTPTRQEETEAFVCARGPFAASLVQLGAGPISEPYLTRE